MLYIKVYHGPAALNTNKHILLNSCSLEPGTCFSLPPSCLALSGVLNGWSFFVMHNY